MKVKLKIYLNLILVLLVLNPICSVRTKKIARKKLFVTGTIGLAVLTASIMGGKKILTNNADRHIIDLYSAHILKMERIKEAFFSESTKACVQAMQSIMLISNNVAEAELRLEMFKQENNIQPKAPIKAIDYTKIKEELKTQSQVGKSSEEVTISAKFVSQHIYKIEKMISQIKLSVKEDTSTRENICFDKTFSKNVKQSKAEAAAKIDKIAKELEADFDIFEIFRDKEEYRQKWLNSGGISKEATIKEAIARNDSVWRKANAVFLFLIGIVGPSGLEKDLLLSVSSAVELTVTEKPSLKAFVTQMAKIVVKMEFTKLLHNIIHLATAKLGVFLNLLTPGSFLFEHMSQANRVRKEEAELSSKLTQTKILASNMLALKSFQTTSLTYNIVVNSEFLKKINNSLEKHISESKYVPKPKGKVKALCSNNIFICSKIVNTTFAEGLVDKDKKVYPRDIYPLFVDNDELVEENLFDYASNTLAESNFLAFNYFFSLDSYRIFKIEVLEEPYITGVEEQKKHFLSKIRDNQERKRIGDLLVIEALRVEELTVFVFKLPEAEMGEYASTEKKKRVDKPYDYGLKGKHTHYYKFKSILREKACKLVSFKPSLYSDKETKNFLLIAQEIKKKVKFSSETVTGNISDLMQVLTLESETANYLDIHLAMRNKVPSKPRFTFKNKKVEVKFDFIDQKSDSSLLSRYTTGHKKCKYHQFLNNYPKNSSSAALDKVKKKASASEKQLIEDFLTRINPSVPIFSTIKNRFSINAMINQNILELIHDKNHLRIRGSGNAKLDGCHYSFQFAEIIFYGKTNLTFDFEANSVGFPSLVSKAAKPGQIAFKNKVYVLFYVFTDDIEEEEKIEANGVLSTINKKMASNEWFAIPQEEKAEIKIFDRTMGIGFDQGHLQIQAFQQPVESENREAAADICAK